MKVSIECSDAEWEVIIELLERDEYFLTAKKIRALVSTPEPVKVGTQVKDAYGELYVMMESRDTWRWLQITGGNVNDTFRWSDIESPEVVYRP